MDKEAAIDHLVSDELHRKAMEFIDCLGDHIAKPRTNVPFPPPMKNHSVDVQLNIINGSATAIKTDHETPETVNIQILKNYKDENKSVDGKLEGPEKDVPLHKVPDSVVTLSISAKQLGFVRNQSTLRQLLLYSEFFYNAYDDQQLPSSPDSSNHCGLCPAI